MNVCQDHYAAPGSWPRSLIFPVAGQAIQVPLVIVQGAHLDLPHGIGCRLLQAVLDQIAAVLFDGSAGFLSFPIAFVSDSHVVEHGLQKSLRGGVILLPVNAVPLDYWTQWHSSYLLVHLVTHF